MPSFLKDVSAFYGTGERNAAGQTLEEFLASYDPYKYKTPSCTTDAVVFSYRESRRDFSGLKLLLVRRSNHPSIGFWALPEVLSICGKIWKTLRGGNWRKRPVSAAFRWNSLPVTGL